MQNLKQTIFLLVATLFMAVSCAKENPKATVPQTDQLQLENAMFLAEYHSDNTKTSLSAGKVSWETSDKVTLFSGAGYGAKTDLSVDYLAEGGRTAIFSGLADKNSASYLAVYPYSESYAYDAASSVLTVEIPSAQTAVAGSFGSGANVSVALSSDKNLNFRNVGALVGISLLKAEIDGTAAVALKAKGSDGQYKNIAGTTSVTIDGQTGVPTATGATSQTVTLSASADGFAENEIYYFAVLPGEYSAFELTLLDAQGGVKATKTYGDDEDYILERSTMIAFEAKLPPLPDEFEVTLDFAKGWPFAEPIVAAAEQESSGEYYTYVYSYPGYPEMTMDLKFGIARGRNQSANQDLDGDSEKETPVNTTHSYSHASGVLSFDSVVDVENAKPAADGGSTFGLIYCPGVKERYMTKVVVEYNSVPSFTFADGTEFKYNASPNANQPSAEQGQSPAVFNLPYGSTGQVAAVEGRSYIVRLRGAGIKISKITIYYSKNKPV